MNKKYIIRLTTQEKEYLEQLINKGKAAARKLTHARILLKADATNSADAGWNDNAIFTCNLLYQHWLLPSKLSLVNY